MGKRQRKKEREDDKTMGKRQRKKREGGRQDNGKKTKKKKEKKNRNLNTLEQCTLN